VRVYDHAAPKNMLDKGSCKEWAAQVKAHPAGFTCHKFGFPHTDINVDFGRDPSNRMLSTRELMNIQQGFENCREALGWDHDIMVHCHWEYDLRTSIQIADAVESIKPLWLEDPLPVDYSDSWKRLCASTKVPICMGENLARREGFKDFILNQGCDILHPDLRNSGGFLETKRIADLAHIFGLPMACHNTGSQVNTYATCQWAASIRDYMACETVTGQGGWMDQVLVLDAPYIKNGFVQVTDKPGLGITLNPDVVKAHLAPGETYWS
jgi:L-alanine-DL-glutamate epimerase-like enolase superfamily enzyme